jgi:hypothetical protein
MDKIAAAAIERLEAEKRRRQDEKVAKGEAVRVQFIPPVVRPDEVADAVIEKEKGRQIAELRERGEIFDDDPVTAIITRVPRCPDRGKIGHRYRQQSPMTATPSLRTSLKSRQSPGPPRSRQGPLVAHRIQVQIAPPTEDDPGAIVEGTYTLTEDGPPSACVPMPMPARPRGECCARRKAPSRSGTRSPTREKCRPRWACGLTASGTSFRQNENPARVCLPEVLPRGRAVECIEIIYEGSACETCRRDRGSSGNPREAHHLFIRSAVIVSFGPTMRLTE